MDGPPRREHNASMVKKLTVTKEQREAVRKRDIAASNVRVHVGPALRNRVSAQGASVSNGQAKAS